MQIVSKSVILGGGFMVLASIGAFMNHGFQVSARAADGGPTVTVGGPLPLPVSAAQNGAWNVGITGTPRVTVGNTVVVKNVDEKGRIPYQEGRAIPCSTSLCFLYFNPVPAGKRLVIENVSGQVDVGIPSVGINAVSLVVPGTFLVWHLTGHTNAEPAIVTVNEKIVAYFEAGQTPQIVAAYHSLSPVGADVQAVISGYMVDLSQ